VVEESVAVELKCVEQLTSYHRALCLNYLKASNLKTCLLFNFERPLLEYRRLSLFDPRGWAESSVEAVEKAGPEGVEVGSGAKLLVS